VYGVRSDRRDEEGDHRECRDQVDGLAESGELDERRQQQRRERVEQRRAVGRST
jgi:hypothetical protein